MTPARALRAFALLWLASLLAAAALRPPLPPDELRYLAVAWEMHANDAWLVPTLNGEPYPHKPPLLFWLLRAGWECFGPSVAWARGLQALAGALALWLTARLARTLAPDLPAVGALAALALGSTVLFLAYSSLIFFDLWQTLWTLLAWTGLLRACRSSGARGFAGWMLFSLAGAAAFLTKGPVAALTLLPVALLRPAWWGAVPRPRAYWGSLALAAAAAAALALAWALPAARAGGSAYAQAILHDQTVDRLGDAADHARPLGWYLAWLPVLAAPALPWLAARWRVRPPAGAAPAPPPSATRLTRFGLAVFLPALLGLSLVAGKQPHYLLPALPGLALALAARLALPSAPPPRGFLASSIAAPMLALSIQVGASLAWGARYDVSEPARVVAAAQAAGRPVAFFGMAYHGAFHFAGRLRAPLANPATPREQRAWLRAHPDGLVALVLGAEAEPRWWEGARSSPFGTRRIALWEARALAAAGYPPRPPPAPAAD